MGKTKYVIAGNYYESYDYKIFKFTNSNRLVSETRKNDLIESIGVKDILNPIICTKNLVIIEGQGRFEARKTLGLPIIFIIDENATEEDCGLLNKYNTKWAATDWINHYVTQGNDNYSNLVNTMKKTKYSAQRVLRLSNYGDKKSKVSDGKIVFTKEQAEKIMKIKLLIDEITEALDVTGRRNDAFYKGCQIMVETEGYNHSHMIKNCIKEKHSYNQMSNLTSQLKEMSRIYNIGLSMNKRLYFEDYMRNKGYNVRNYDNNHYIVNKRNSSIEEYIEERNL